MWGPLGLASAPPGKWFLYLTMPVAMEMIRTEQEGIGRWMDRETRKPPPRHTPLGPRPGHSGECSRKSLRGPSVGTKWLRGCSWSARARPYGAGPHSGIQHYHNNCNSHSSFLLHGSRVPGTGINSQISAPEVGTIINPISQMRKLKLREMKSLVQDTQLLSSRARI